jgi:hypothetical protein
MRFSLIAGEIVALGPGGVGFSMTRGAALDTQRGLAVALAAAGREPDARGADHAEIVGNFG